MHHIRRFKEKMGFGEPNTTSQHKSPLQSPSEAYDQSPFQDTTQKSLSNKQYDPILQAKNINAQSPFFPPSEKNHTTSYVSPKNCTINLKTICRTKLR